MKTIVSALIALSVLTSVAAPASAFDVKGFYAREWKAIQRKVRQEHDQGCAAWLKHECSARRMSVFVLIGLAMASGES